MDCQRAGDRTTRAGAGVSKRNVVALSDRLSKLRAMSVREVAERVRYGVVTTRERRRHRASAFTSAALEKRLAPELRGVGWERRLLYARAQTSGHFLPGTY